MPTIIVSHDQVYQLLPMAECIQVMRETFEALARGQALLPLRQAVRLPRGNVFGSMPAYLESIGFAGVKVVTVFPGNHGTRYDSHQGAVLLFETEHGSLQAVVDATAITAIRTAAVSALATDLLARTDACDLAILGSGTQARTHLEAMMLVRPIRRVRVWSRSQDHACRFSEQESRRRSASIESVPDAAAAVAGADLICTVTASPQPVLFGDWIAPGAHINAVGASLAPARELDTTAVARSRLFVDRRESTLSESGDFLVAKQEGAIDDTHIQGEIGDVLLGKVAARCSPDEITLFKSLGLAVEDLAAAHHVWRKAIAAGGGLSVDLAREA